MDLIKRNIPVLVIGIITFLIFIGIIIAGQLNPPASQQPILKQANEQELIKPHTYILGSIDAPVTLVEFSDYECPACTAFQPVIRALYESNSGLLRVAYRHYPLPQHPNARKAAEAAQAAGMQDKFWEYSDTLYENNTNLTDEDLIRYAEELGLGVEKFREDLNSGTVAAQVNEDLQDASKLNLSFTPSFFLNGELMQIRNAQDFQDQVIREINKVRKNESENENLNETKTDSHETGSDEVSGEVINSIEVENGNEETNIETSVNIDTEAEDGETLVIKYTQEGFSPKTSTGYLNKKVRFINTTDETITIEQTDNKFEEFGKARTLGPGEQYEMIFTQDKLWRFKEKTSGNYGSIFIY